MWFISKMFYRNFYKNCEFAISAWVNRYVASAITEICDEIQHSLQSLNRVLVDIPQHESKIDELLTYRDELGRKCKYETPIVTEDEFAGYKKQSGKNKLYTVILLIFETCLFSLFVYTSFPKQYRIPLISIPMGFGFTICAYLLFHHSLHKFYNYKAIKHIVLTENIDRTALYKHKTYYFLSILGLALFVILNLSLGLGRSMLMESSEVGNQVMVVVLKISAMVLTLASSIVLAFQEDKMIDIRKKEHLYKEWKTLMAKINKDIELAMDLPVQLDRYILDSKMKCWQLVEDIRLIFNLENDTKYNAMDKEYAEKEHSVSTLNHKEYYKYIKVQPNHPELLEFGIIRHPEVLKLRSQYDRLATIVKDKSLQLAETRDLVLLPAEVSSEKRPALPKASLQEADNEAAPVIVTQPIITDETKSLAKIAHNQLNTL